MFKAKERTHILQNFTSFKRKFKEILCCFGHVQNFGEFCYVFYVISVVLLVFILWNARKLVTVVTETRRR